MTASLNMKKILNLVNFYNIVFPYDLFCVKYSFTVPTDIHNHERQQSNSPPPKFFPKQITCKSIGSDEFGLRRKFNTLWIFILWIWSL